MFEDLLTLLDGQQATTVIHPGGGRPGINRGRLLADVRAVAAGMPAHPSGESLERSDVCRALMSELPRAAWPSTVVVCDRIPVNARGKVSRRGFWRLMRVEAA